LILGLSMPSLTRLIIFVFSLIVTVYFALLMLVTFVEPRERTLTMRVDQQLINEQE